MQRILVIGALTILLVACAAAQGNLGPIRQVTVGRNAEFHVNGRPFFPA